MNLLVIIYLLFACYHSSSFVVVATALPSFDRANENVTVIIGSSTVLPCFISNLGDHKVAWIKVANTDVLAIGDYKVTNDDRIKLVHGYVTDWSLSIQPVNEEDAGEYICQINTEPQMITKINLQVLLPPKIIEEKSTISPEPVREGDTLTLYCHTEGVPKPKVSWYFRKRQHLTSSSSSSHHHHHQQHHSNPNSSQQQQHSKNSAASVAVATAAAAASSNNLGLHEQIIHEGDTFVVKNVSRFYSGVFECIANNSVPPAASRKIKVSIEFAPEIRVNQERVEQTVGQDARFECRIRASPLMNHYWMKDDRVIENGVAALNQNDITTGSSGNTPNKYEIVTYNQNSHEHLTISALIVKNVSKQDFGVYQCYAVNSHNITKAEIELREIQNKRFSSSTKSSVSKILVYNNNGGGGGENGGAGLLRQNTKHPNQSKQQRKTNNSLYRLNSSGGSSKTTHDNDNDYFEHDPNENTLTLINSGIGTTKTGLERLLLSSICLFLIQKFLF